MINRIPRSKVPGAAATGVTVSGAGSTAVNGHWDEAGIVGGKMSYTFNSLTSVWDDLGLFWNLSVEGEEYISFDDVATLDLVTTWDFLLGDPPLPTIVAG